MDWFVPFAREFVPRGRVPLQNRSQNNNSLICSRRQTHPILVELPIGETVKMFSFLANENVISHVLRQLGKAITYALYRFTVSHHTHTTNKPATHRK